MSRRICADLYDQIVKLRPSWHADDDAEGKVKVVITGSASDGPELRRHVPSKDRLVALKKRAKDPEDPLELVVVRDMWLTGFDSPALHTMYVDKPMRGAALMQAIARVNRTFRDKPGGLVVDYIGIAESLRYALADYTERDRTGKELGASLDEALLVLEEAPELCEALLLGCPWREALSSGSHRRRLGPVMAALDRLLAGREEQLPERFLHQERRARQAFALAVSSPETARYRDDLAFFQAVAVELRRATSDASGGAGDDVEVETALRQVVSEAVVASGVVDIYGAAGMARPDISLIDDDFAPRAATSPHPNLQVELLRRLLAEELRSEQGRGASLGLRDDELAFYDAVRQNDSAVLELGDEVLKQIAQELVSLVRANTSVDWDKKEQVRALLRSKVRRLLTKYHYPPDRQESAVLLVMEQAERLASEVVG